MDSLLRKIYQVSPHYLQNTMVSMFDLIYLKRHGGNYKHLKEYYKKAQKQPYEQLLEIQNKRFNEFFSYVMKNSSFYKEYYSNINLSLINKVDDLKYLPIIEKEIIRKNIDSIVTIPKNKSFISHTGGTTGKSLEVYFRWEDIQDRFAMFDAYREKYGYKFGKRTAWFSGKTILNQTDEKKKRFWKYDYLFNIRYYSTFHITPENIPYIIEDLNSYKPEMISGFPSNIYEIAYTAKINNIPFYFKPDLIMTTAETLLPNQVKIIEEVFNCKVYDRYGSSEGATYVFQCYKGKMHYQLLSGIIEIVDEKMQPANEGEILITSFATGGTPLIRYRIGDSMNLSDERCDCGDNQPIISSILGRKIDFIYSKERGKINLGNISNCVKNLNGVKRFQIIQKQLDEINVKIIIDKMHYTNQDEIDFKKELINRLGNSIKINFHYVKEIKKSRSGKYCIVKNNIAHLVK